MTDQEHNNTENVLMAIDIAKHHHEVLVSLPDGKRLQLAYSGEDER